jgi:hypothetical protein
MSDTTVHVFVGTFVDRRAARDYTEQQRDTGPDSPTDGGSRGGGWDGGGRWPLRDDLRLAFLDRNFVQAVDGPQRWSYLAGLLTDPDDIDRIRAMAGPAHNVLVLVFEDALGGQAVAVRSTAVLTYCGAWPVLY